MTQSCGFLALAAIGLLALGGCVAYPAEQSYYAPAPFYVAPPPVVFFGGGYRPNYGRPYGYGGRGYGGRGHGGWGHRGWR